MSQISIKAEGIGKEYIIGGAEQQYENFGEMLAGVFANPFRKFKTLSGNVAAQRRFWALKDIDFEIHPGEIVGVIGRNGAGKSTLLKVLSRITAPTTGRISISGRVASLLEVGTGFHPELTGRENIYLNGSILGMRREQIDNKFDEIVEFADISQFLDTPVKRYSSGMGVRLAFSIAAHLDSDVLLVDEVLAVGDQKFQEKCLGKLENVSSQGRTVLFVSHNLSSVTKLCNRILVLEKGLVSFDGKVHDGISHYHQQLQSGSLLEQQDYIGELFPTLTFNKILFDGAEFLEGQEIEPLRPLEITLNGRATHRLAKYKTVLSIRKDGQLIFSQFDNHEMTTLAQGDFVARFQIPERLLPPGEYTCSFGGVTDISHQWLWTRDYRFIVPHRWAPDYDSTSSVLGLINMRTTGSRSEKA